MNGKDMDEETNIYLAWDARAAQAPASALPDAKPFLAERLHRESQRTKRPLSAAQADLLAYLVDSFVDEAGRRHRQHGQSATGEDDASKDWANELRTPLYEEKDTDQDAGLAAFFQRLKLTILSRIGKEFGGELAAHVDDSEHASVQRLFSSPVQKEEWKKLKANALEPDERRGQVELERIKGLLAVGSRAKEIETILAEAAGEHEEAAAKCLTEALASELFSPAEQLVRKLAAADFLLALMNRAEATAAEGPEEAELPFLAVAAARYAYDWLTEWKTTVQLGELAWAENALGLPGNEREGDAE